MSNKIKKVINTKPFYFILGALIFGTIGVSAATYFPSNDVTYDNTESGLTSTNVQGAIDELYGVCTEVGKLTDLLPSSNPDELYEDNHGDIRYYGKNPNNYLYFNCTDNNDKTTCELWRIIGVIDGKIKIVRNESVSEMNWGSNRNNWDNSPLKKYLNETYYNSVALTYKTMISEETYYLGGPYNDMDTMVASEYYDKERSGSRLEGNPASTKQYIGLMYPSDYGYAAGETCMFTELYDFHISCADNNYLYNGVEEWLQIPFSSSYEYAVCITENGSINGRNIMNDRAFRPVLYLTTATKITGGTGTQNDPYTIE